MKASEERAIVAVAVLALCSIQGNTIWAAEESRIQKIMPDLGRLDVFTVALAVKECLYSAGFYQMTDYYKVETNQPLDEVYYKEKIFEFDEALCRSYYWFTRACHDGHDAALCLLYTGKNQEALARESAVKKFEESYYPLLMECKGLAKLDKKDPAQAKAVQKQLIERLRSNIQEMERFAGDSAPIVSAHRKQPPESPRKEFEKYYFSSQVGLMPSGYKSGKYGPLQVPFNWNAVFVSLQRKIGIEANRGFMCTYQPRYYEGAEKLYRQYDTKSGYEDGTAGSRVWNMGMVADGISQRDMYVSLKTGEKKPFWEAGTYFYDDDVAVRYMEDIYKTAMLFRDKDWFYTYNSGNEIHLHAETDGFTGYGEVPRQFFLKWLKAKYGDIRKTNAAWGTQYARFEDIQLPYQWPEKPEQHAIWEDWARFREYIIARHHQCFYDAVKEADKNHPVINRTLWHSGGFNKNIVLTGYDHYELCKAVDFDGAHIAGGNYPADVENSHGYYFMHFNSTGKRMYESEWTPFHSTGMSHSQVNLGTRRRLYTDAFQGGVGWMVFCFGDNMMEIGIGHYGPFFGYLRIDGYPNLIGWEMKEFIDRSKTYEHILAGGRELMDDVAFLWSQTNYHHEPDKWKETREIGYILNVLNNFQYARKVLFEQEILENTLTPERYRVVIMPRTDYLNADVTAKLLDYVKQGGTLIATGTAGRYTGYGKENGLICAAAGVKAQPVAADPASVTYQLGAATGAEILAKSSDGSVVSVEVPVGKGKIILIGSTQPQYYERTLSRTKARRICDLNSRSVLARLWEYKGKRYLALVNIHRTDWQNLEIVMPGGERLKDLYLGMFLPKKEGGGLLTSLMPGEGRIYEAQ